MRPSVSNDVTDTHFHDVTVVLSDSLTLHPCMYVVLNVTLPCVESCHCVDRKF